MNLCTVRVQIRDPETPTLLSYGPRQDSRKVSMGTPLQA